MLIIRISYISITYFLILNSSLAGQDSEAAQDKENSKTGYMWVPLPAFYFNTDKGLTFGAVLSIYDFDDGQYYPNTKKNIMITALYSTKGSADISVNYDNKYLIKNTRVNISAIYKNDQCYQFYGINGYQAYFDSTLSKTFYYYDKKNILVAVDFMHDLGKNLQWKAGYGFNLSDNKNADLEKINKGKEESEQFYGETMFEKYSKWGVINSDEAGGGVVSCLNLGLRYDTRDQEAAPQYGILADADLELAPGFLGTTHPYYQYELNWRHYVAIVKEHLVFAYKLDYTGTIGRSVPYYSMPVNNSVRGILINRIEALDIAMASTELRWLFRSVRILKQNVAFGANVFFDTARGIRYYDTSFKGEVEYRAAYDEYMSSGSAENWHGAAGGGIQTLN